MGELFRTDAKGESDYVVLGRWSTAGGLDTKRAPWFSIKLTSQDCPWLFEKGHGSRTISASEMLATLVALELFVQDRGESSGVARVHGLTDNAGNTFIIKKLYTSAFPTAAVLMQLASAL